jgi:hypothetical protein
VQEPYLSEINNYIRQRREHITFFTTPQVRQAAAVQLLAQIASKHAARNH